MTSPISLYRFLLTRILLLVAIIVTAGMSVQWYFEKRLLESQFDETLIERATTLATLVSKKGGHLKLEFADEFMPRYSREEQPYFFQIWYPDGRWLERSYSLRGEDLPFRHGPLSAPAKFQTTLASGVQVRCVGIEFPPRHGADSSDLPSVIIALAAGSAQLEDHLKQGHIQVAITGSVSVAGLSILVLLALKRGLHLLRRIVNEVEQITPDSLDQPLDERRVAEEVRPIIAALNRSLRTIRGFVERERRFTADVAHELRTPIAELRAAADVALHWPEDESSQRLAVHAQAIALQMGSLVESLLNLALLESEAPQGQLEELDLARVVGHLVEQATHGPAGEREILVDSPPSLRLTSRSQLWEVTLRNLLDNALSHSQPGSRVEVVLRADGDGARLRVSNSTDSLDEEGLAHCTERLWRADRARKEGRHFGLGLSIVQAACAKLGHRFAVRLEKGVFHATVWRTGDAPADWSLSGAP